MRIKFFISPVYPYGNDHYFHEIIAIAEGFEALGYTILGNTNYWWLPEKKTYLILENLTGDFDIAIYDYRYARSFEHLLFRKGYPNFDKSKKHVLIDRNDWISPFWLNNQHYKIYDLICAGNLYKNFDYPSNVKPWAIGTTSRIENYIDKSYSKENKTEPIIGYNFRVSHNMRGYLLSNLLSQKIIFPLTEKFTDSIQQNDIDLPEIDKLYWKQSSKRHNPEYYKTLNNSLLFLAFGGYYETKPLRYQPYSIIDKITRKPTYWKYQYKKNRGLDFSNEIFIFQQDNFRFWEVLYSGAVPINLDLDFWNFLLPETPKKGIHYLGIEHLDGASLVKTINKMSEKELKTIGAQGREWCKEHYSPKAAAKRILTYLNL